MNWLNNICWLSDSYKVSHYKQYPPETKRIYSYFESRSGSVHPATTFFGLQYWLKQYLVGKVVTAEKIDKAERLFNAHFGGKVFNREGWEYILNFHDGRLPIEIKAAPEGTVVKESNVLMTVENTDDKVYWLTNYLETLLVQVWYPSTVATQSRAMKKVILQYLQQTGDVSLIDFKLHDFGFRGVTCPEQAAIGGASHLVEYWWFALILVILLLLLSRFWIFLVNYPDPEEVGACHSNFRVDFNPVLAFSQNTRSLKTSSTDDNRLIDATQIYNSVDLTKLKLF